MAKQVSFLLAFLIVKSWKATSNNKVFWAKCTLNPFSLSLDVSLSQQQAGILFFLSVQGFFIEDHDSQLHLLNPGPGAQCEGKAVVSVRRTV